METETPAPEANESARVELPGIALHALAQKWADEWRGAYIQTLRSVGEETFILKIRTREKNVEMLIQLPELVTETQRKWPALADQPSIVNATKELLDNAQILEVKQHGLDRILVIKCKSCTLIVELFGDGNILVLDANGKIAFVHHAREWKGRTLKKNQVYQFPSGPRAWNEWPAQKKEMVDTKPFRSVGGWMVGTLGVPPAWVEEWGAAIKREAKDEEPLSESEWKKLRAHAQKMWERIEKKREFVRIENTILPAVNEKNKSKEMDQQKVFSIIEANILSGKKHEKKDTRKENELAALRVNLARQEAQTEAWEKKAREAQQKGEWIYTHYGEVEDVLNALARAKKQKLNAKAVQAEIRKRYPIVARVEMEKDEVEWDEE